MFCLVLRDEPVVTHAPAVLVVVCEQNTPTTTSRPSRRKKEIVWCLPFSWPYVVRVPVDRRLSFSGGGVQSERDLLLLEPGVVDNVFSRAGSS